MRLPWRMQCLVSRSGEQGEEAAGEEELVAALLTAICFGLTESYLSFRCQFLRLTKLLFKRVYLVCVKVTANLMGQEMAVVRHRETSAESVSRGRWETASSSLSPMVAGCLDRSCRPSLVQ